MGVSPEVRDHKELGAAILCSMLLIFLVLGSLVEVSPPHNVKRILEHALVVAHSHAVSSPVAVSDPTSDQQIVSSPVAVSEPTSDQQIVSSPVAVSTPTSDQRIGTKIYDHPSDPFDAASSLADPLAAASPAANRPAGTDVHNSVHHDAEDITGDYNTKILLPASVESLIRDIREAASLANGGESVEPAYFDEDGKKDWHEKNPCMSREKLSLRYPARKYAKDVEANPGWDAVFREYQILHRTCTRKLVQNVSQYFHTRDSSTPGCKFFVCDARNPSGLGNKILITVSCFLYALLTQRVLLVPSSDIPPVTNIMCEPFEGSSWKLDRDTIGLPMPSPLWASMQQLLSVVDSTSMQGSQHDDISSTIHENGAASTTSVIYAADVTDNYYAFHPDNRFFCLTEQIFLRNVTWVNLVGNQYFVPKLFGIPIFRTTLEDLFPDRLVLTHLLRRLMLPGDSVWVQVENVQAMQPEYHADRRLGVQIRYLGGQEQFDLMHTSIETRIKECALQNGMLPHHTESAEAENSQSLLRSSTAQSVNSSAVPRGTTVFVASLYDNFEKALVSDYLHNPAANGENVTVVQLSNRHDQGFTVEEDIQALTEMIFLSFSDDLIVTPRSTFGIVAQGYGALKPWFVGMEVSDPPCTRGQTVDGCYHIPEKNLFCPFDPELNGVSILEIVPYVKDCLPVDRRDGIQLITS
ncbi:hypothetical protein CY35_03G135900 [Sphagnum magellanicum]|nr:hypothetical protein CY35_03G135900 [Sphagnum magellanicum]